jgi:hypothetical protein
VHWVGYTLHDKLLGSIDISAERIKEKEINEHHRYF